MIKNTSSWNITEQKKTEEQLESSYRLLNAIKKAQSIFIVEPTSKQVFDGLLSDILDLTQSKFGFIGEILFNSEGKPFLKTHTITNIAWNKETQELYNKYAGLGLEFHNMDTLFGEVILTGKPVISNNPSKDSRRGGLPKGHPPLNSFLGLPFYHRQNLIGMVGMANRPEGYQENLIEYLQPFLGTCSNLIQALKNDQRRKKAEAALTETLSRFNRLAENLTDFLIYSHGVDGVFTYISPTITSVLGYTPEEFKCHYSEYLTDNPINQKVEYYTNLTLKGLKQPSYDLEVFHKNGNRCCLEISETPILDDQGKVIGVEGIAKNITERKKAEDQLEFIQYGVDHAADAAFWLQLEDSKFSYVNKQACESLGYTQEELLTMSVFDIDPDYQPDTWPDFQKSLKENQSLTFETRVQKKNGEFFSIELHVHLASYQGKDYVLAVARDITERKKIEDKLKEAHDKLETRVQERTLELTEANEKLEKEAIEREDAEEALRESQVRYRSLFKNSPVSIWEEDFSDVKAYLDELQFREIENFELYLDQHPEVVEKCIKLVKVISVNQTTINLFETEDQDSLLAGLPQIFTKDAEETFKKELTAMRQGGNFLEFETDLLTLKGKKLKAMISWTVPPGYEKMYSRVLVSVVNVTERKLAEDTLKNINDELEKRIKGRTIELEQKNLALKEILSQIEIEKKQIGDSIIVNSEKLLLPLIKKLRKKDAGKYDKIFSLLEDNIKNLTSNFGGKLSGSLIKMSPKEIEICNLIKNGFDSKEISSFLSISNKTVDTHRRNIRLKLGLAGKKINLTSYLNSI